MLDWIFEGIVTWVASIMTQIMDAISGVFLGALGTDMTAMEAGPRRHLRCPDRLRKANIQHCTGYCPSAVYSLDGRHT